MTDTLLVVVLRLAFIGLLAFLAARGLQPAVRQVERRLQMNTADPERLGRLRTLVEVGRGFAFGLILVTAGLMALFVLGINITPLLAGAGVAGLALSLGAQTLIKDYLAGILILVEDQYQVGDVIGVAGQSGEVERITLRATHLRDGEGRLHIVPNGEIRVVSNQTRDWARAVVDLNVAFDADFAKVARALEVAAVRASEDPAIKADLLEAPQAVGRVGLNDWAVQVRVTAKTAAGRQWGVGTALRRHAVEALRAEGVRPALPSQEVRMEEAK